MIVLKLTEFNGADKDKNSLIETRALESRPHATVDTPSRWFLYARLDPHNCLYSRYPSIGRRVQGTRSTCVGKCTPGQLTQYHLRWNKIGVEYLILCIREIFDEKSFLCTHEEGFVRLELATQVRYYVNRGRNSPFLVFLCMSESSTYTFSFCRWYFSMTLHRPFYLNF